MNQTERILEHLNKYGSISQKEAFLEYGIMRLASRISDLKNKGFKIKKEMVKSKNRRGETVRYAKYSLECDENECN